MSRTTGALVVALCLAVLVAGAWWARSRPARVVEAGEPLPFDRSVERHFPGDAPGETETWTLEKKRTAREESLATAPLPTPDPAAGDHVPDESARTLDGLALEAWKTGDIGRAAELFEESIAADPHDRVPRSHLGRLLTLATDYERALPHLERAAQLAPDDPQVWLDLQSVYERTLSLDRALEARRRAEQLSGGRTIVRNEMGVYELEGGESFP